MGAFLLKRIIFNGGLKSMKTTHTLTLCILVNFLVSACSREIPSDPMCRVQAQLKELPPAPAACLIKLNGKLLALKKHTKQTWQLPSEKLQKNTSAQCSAHIAVWKTTGLNVEVGKLLLKDKNNIHYFSCQTSNPFSTNHTTMPVPAWSKHRIFKIKLVNPFETSTNEWAKKIDLIQVRQAFTKLEELN